MNRDEFILVGKVCHVWWEGDNVMTVRKVNFGVFPELYPLFRFSLDNRYAQRRCTACRKRASVLYAQEPGDEGPQFANSKRPDAYCWECAATVAATTQRLAGEVPQQ